MSAFWIEGLVAEEIWPLGDFAGQPRGKAALAFAEFTRKDVAEVGLFTEDDPEPHPRHLNVCGWPSEKDAAKSLALELCVRAILRLRGQAAEGA